MARQRDRDGRAARGPRQPISLLVLVLAATALAGLAGCDRAKDEKSAKQAAPMPPPPAVVVAEVTQQTVPIVREFTARTEGVPTVEVRARVAGMLEKVLYQEGTEVKQGQTLFELQVEEYAAALETAKAQLAKAQADLTRARDTSVVDRAKAQLEQRRADLEKAKRDVARYLPLAQAKAIPQQDLDTAESQEKVAVAAVDAQEAVLKDTQLAQRTQIQLSEAGVQSAKASITQAELNLGYTRITAPISGIIGKIQVDRGNLVGKNEPTLLATISAVDPISVDFPVVEADYLKLAPRIKLDAQGNAQSSDYRFDLILADGSRLADKGRVTFVDRAVDPKTGTIGVRAEFPNPKRLVRPGQFARVRGTVEEKPNAILVPQLAVQDQQGAKVVYVVEGGDKVALRAVSLDERIGEQVIVTKGVKPGERVIVDGVQKVRPGVQVKLVQRASDAAPQVAEPSKAPAPPAATEKKVGG